MGVPVGGEEGPAPRGPAISLTFGRGRRPAARAPLGVQPRDAAQRELVAGFEGGRAAPVNGAPGPAPGKAVVPRQEDTFQVAASGARRFNANRCGPPHSPQSTGCRLTVWALRKKERLCMYSWVQPWALLCNFCLQVLQAEQICWPAGSFPNRRTARQSRMRTASW